MKKHSFLLFLMASITHAVIAQTITAAGIVKDARGNPLHYAFVQDKKVKNSTYTDSLGMFSLAVDPASKLFIRCNGFRDTSININNQVKFSIVLKIASGTTFNPTGQDFAAGGNNGTASQQSFKDKVTLDQPTAPPSGANVPKLQVMVGLHEPQVVGTETYFGQGSEIPVFTVKEETRGSRYLFDKWEPGYVVNSKDSVIKRPNFMFNYDKMGGGLLLTQDERTAIEVNRYAIKSFTVYDNAQMPMVFENVPTIDRSHYVEVIATGEKYSIYKLITTKFQKSDYSTNGLSTSGNPYDEYIDEGNYFVIKGSSGQPKKISLKKKSIKEAFGAEGNKLIQFMTDHSADNIDDNYLKTLGDYINK